MDNLRIGILGYNGVTAINVANVLEVFASASAIDRTGCARKCYDPITIGFDGERFVSESGIAFAANYSVDDAPPVDTLFVPGGSGLRDQAKGRAVAEWVKSQMGRTRRIASVCTGVYGIAPSGLLDGRRVTTHWEYARDVARRFPQVRVEESNLYIKDDRFYSSAGATAGIDLALALITEDFGRDVSLRVAQQFLVYLERDGGQEQYSAPLVVTDNIGAAFTGLNTDRMSKLLRWIAHHLSADLSLEKLAAKAHLSKRELLAQFSEAFGAPPGLFVKHLRLNEARCMLLRREVPSEIAKSLRFQNPAYFIQEFRRRFGALPDDYRRRFSTKGSKTNSISEPDIREQASLTSPPKRSANYRRPRITSFTRCVRAQADQADKTSTN